jgi:hypothetical protein
MEIFGNKKNVCVAIFAADQVPSPGKLKKMFGSSYAFVYKSYGRYSSEMAAIEEVISTEAALRGQSSNALRGSYDIVVLDESASFSVFTLIANSSKMSGTYKLSADLYKYLQRLIHARDQIKWNLGLCEAFLRSADRIQEQAAIFGKSDPNIDALDVAAFRANYAECGKGAFLAIEQLLAAELPNVLWIPFDGQSAEASDEPQQAAVSEDHLTLPRAA